MKLNGVTVGPIIGETTPTRVRIWGRGQGDVIDGLPRRCFGALRYAKAGSGDWHKPVLFKMNPNFDMTGIAIVEKLEPSTHYEYQMGYFFSDAEISDAGFSGSDWGNIDIGAFQTASDDDTEPRSLVIGSCRYLLKTFLGDFFDDRGDKTFRSILEQIDSGSPVHQLLMMGDQIYADDLKFVGQDRSVDKFYKRYRSAFGQRYIRDLMSRTPTYMTLDDHEIEDNWPTKACDKDWKTLYPNAIHAYQSYQLSHSPNIPIKKRRLTGTPNHFWYKYSDGCCDIFVTDSRTERAHLVDGTSEMISQEQMSALKRWLKDASGRVKIVVTSVPFAPDSAQSESKDKWSGYHAQRVELLEHIETHQIERVVFFSGDIHASLSLELVSPTGLKVHSVVSSSFFWPYPHPSARHFRTKGTIDAGQAGVFSLANPSKVVGDDNFTRVEVAPQGMEISVYGRKGELMDRSVRQF
ncbi:MAG: alkaline phosphatase family protein [Rhodobiaceae bacterium]|nr:alkaline phosphatase D [Rhodobiaceae bacterium]MCR9242081.1 alkaline phosphatase family protein [Rhodobiaceae bacterium]